MKNAIVLLSVFLPAITLAGCKCNRKQVVKPAAKQVVKHMGELKLEVLHNGKHVSGVPVKLSCHAMNIFKRLKSKSSAMKIKLPSCLWAVEVLPSRESGWMEMRIAVNIVSYITVSRYFSLIKRESDPCPEANPVWNKEQRNCEACPNDTYWDPETGKCKPCADAKPIWSPATR